MQGGTVEHATALAAPGDLSRGWSYTALSRARRESQLHIEGAPPSAASLEREEVAGAETKAQANVEQILARVEVRMRERDDEDLAITQLPYAPAAGRGDNVEPAREACDRRSSSDESPEALIAELAGASRPEDSPSRARATGAPRDHRATRADQRPAPRATRKAHQHPPTWSRAARPPTRPAPARAPTPCRGRKRRRAAATDRDTPGATAPPADRRPQRGVRATLWP